MASLQSLVVVDPDARSRDALAFGFEREGCVVHSTADPREALALAETRVPQLVVAGASVAAAEGARFLRQLRASPRAEATPVVVLGAPERRSDVLAAGADDYVSRPAFIRDVVMVARLLIARRDGEVTASVDEFGLFFLTRALIAAEKSGVMTLLRKQRSGELRFHAGELTGARVGGHTGANAFHHLLLWESASFRLRFGVPQASGRRIRKPVARLLDDGARFVGEFRSAAKRVGGVSAVFVQDARRLRDVRRQIPAEVLALIGNYDGQRALLDVVEDSPFRPIDTVMITHRLVELGVLVPPGMSREEQRGDGAARQIAADVDIAAIERAFSGFEHVLAPAAESPSTTQVAALAAMGPEAPSVVDDRTVPMERPAFLESGADETPSAPQDTSKVKRPWVRTAGSAQRRRSERAPTVDRRQMPAARPHEHRTAFEALEEEFFARENELLGKEEIDNFDDLVDPPSEHGSPASKRRWFAKDVPKKK